MPGIRWNDEFVEQDLERRQEDARDSRRRRRRGRDQRQTTEWRSRSEVHRRQDRKFFWRRLRRSVVRTFLLLLVLAALGVGVKGALWREQSITARYEGLQPAGTNDRAALERRLADIDHLIAGNPLWLGAFRASEERSELRAQIRRLEGEEAEAARKAERELQERLDAAESARVHARTFTEQRQFAKAAEYLRIALDVAPPDWSERERVASDLEALESLVQRQGSR